MGSGEPALSPPAAGRVVSRFDLRRHPIFQTLRLHPGIDYSGVVGDPVLAAATGEVVFAGLREYYGSVIVVRHDSRGLETTYAHLSRIDVKAGDCVRQRQTIGAIGTSGTSSNAHLHFEVTAKVDPLQYLPALAP